MSISSNPVRALLLAALASAAAAQAPKPAADLAYTQLASSDLLDFRYSFPTIVGTYPALLAKIRADEDSQRAEALAGARGDREMRAAADFPFHRHEYWRDWTVIAQAGRLLSLQSHVDTFTGGAHGNHVSEALLWDMERDAEVDLGRLFGGSAKLWGQIGSAYCRQLEALPRRKAAGSVGCPDRKDLTIVPVDSDFDYEFDSLRIIADPYVAGSYAEGAYVISIASTPALLKSLDPAYRNAFEARVQ